MFTTVKQVLVLAPHTDDGELGCGGTIAKLIANGAKVTYVAFSTCEESLPEGLPKDTLKKEVTSATQALGIKDKDLIVFDFNVRKFPAYRQEILEKMVKLSKEIGPDLVFLPSSDDVHQDHKTISEEGFRAFKKTTVLGYELPWNNTAFKTQAFSKLTDEALALKVKALSCYASQSHRDYTSEEFVKAWAKMRGIQAGASYAEAFEVLRSVF